MVGSSFGTSSPGLDLDLPLLIFPVRGLCLEAHGAHLGPLWTTLQPFQGGAFPG